MRRNKEGLIAYLWISFGVTNGMSERAELTTNSNKLTNMKDLITTIITIIIVIFFIILSFQIGQEREQIKQLKQIELELRLNGGDLISFFE